MITFLAALMFMQSAVGTPVPARLPGDPEAPQLPPVSLREAVVPVPLVPQPSATPSPGGVLFTPRDLRRLTIIPTASIASGLVVPMALGARSGDWGTPGVELLAGYGGGYMGTAAAIGITGIVEALGPRPDPKIGFSRPAAVTAVVGMTLLPPAATGLAVFHAGEGMQGRSRHRTQNLFAAMGGALAAEAILAGSAITLRQPPGPAMTLAFIPMAAGATLAYDLARGPHRGPRRAAMPPIVISGRF